MLFSIIMCTHNSGKTLEYAITSVRNQICQDWEMLILDNGSVDESVKIIRCYEEIDSRIKGIYLKYNVGWPKGISICLTQTAGKYMIFLGADDLLYSNLTLQEVRNEIEKNNYPDIIWTGYTIANFVNGKFRVRELGYVPQYKVYNGEDKKSEKIQVIADTMRDVWYNSVMHYIRIDFLKKWRIDFYSPFYGDSQGMQEALVRADKMVVMDQIEYILTANTSQTSKAIGIGEDIAGQWESVKMAIPDWRDRYGDTRMEYIANRILQNRTELLEGILAGQNVRDLLQNEVQLDMAERFLLVEKQISSHAFGEMMLFAGRSEHTERLIGAAGVLYWESKKMSQAYARIREQSKWLADFAEVIMEPGEDGILRWKEKVTDAQMKKLMILLASKHNPHHVGAELLVSNGLVGVE